MKERQSYDIAVYLIRMSILLFLMLNIAGCVGAVMAKKNTVRAFDQLNRGDFQTFLEQYDDQATMIYPGNVSASGKQIGKEAIEKWYNNMTDRGLLNNFTIKNICVEDVFAMGGTNVVAVQWVNNVTNPKGEKVTYNGVTVVRVENMKVIHVQDYIFESEMLKKVWGEE